MKKWPGGTVLASLLSFLVLGNIIRDNSLANSSFQAILYHNSPDTVRWFDMPGQTPVQEPQNASQVVPDQSPAQEQQNASQVVSHHSLVQEPQSASQVVYDQSPVQKQQNASQVVLNQSLVQQPQNASQVVLIRNLTSSLSPRNLSKEETSHIHWSDVPDQSQESQNASQVVSDQSPAEEPQNASQVVPDQSPIQESQNASQVVPDQSIVHELQNLSKVVSNQSQVHEPQNSFQIVPDQSLIQESQNASHVVSIRNLTSTLFSLRNLSKEVISILQTWKQLKHIWKSAHSLPKGVEAIQEANDAWENLMVSVEEEKIFMRANNGSGMGKRKVKQCSYSILQMNSSGLGVTNFLSLKIPCGLVHGSSLTFIGIPEGIFGEFKINLTGTTIPGEPYTPILLHYSVRFGDDTMKGDPVILQNTWTATTEWSSEERCPPDGEFNETAKVDGLAVCDLMESKDEEQTYPPNTYFNVSRESLVRKQRNETRKNFPFRRGHLAIATLRVGSEGLHMTVDGKHITSFAFHQSLEPWLASEVRFSGDIKLLSITASGLPSSEDIDHVLDLELLEAPHVPVKKSIKLVIGVFSSANNFKQRMSIRRTWMQYNAVRSGLVVVRFFVGLHKNQVVNDELWNEGRTYGDVQLLPFVDYYDLITWKTISICIYGTKVVPAKYIMKTDDDAFVRVDEILKSLKQAKSTSGLLFGKINFDDEPRRELDSKWYITTEEYPEEKYPPFAHGPGYIVSRNIAKAVYKQHKEGSLKMFKLEDVAMGIWANEINKTGVDIQYVNDDRIHIDGCQKGYILAHYQQPRKMLCLWEKLQTTKQAICCED